MMDGPLRSVLLGIVILLGAIFVETLSPGQPWVAFGAIFGIIGLSQAAWGFLEAPRIEIRRDHE